MNVDLANIKDNLTRDLSPSLGRYLILMLMY